jgi:hypothetical protein
MHHILRKTAFFEPFIYKNDHFAETGSGQTWGNSKKDGVFRTIGCHHSGQALYRAGLRAASHQIRAESHACAWPGLRTNAVFRFRGGFRVDRWLSRACLGKPTRHGLWTKNMRNEKTAPKTVFGERFRTDTHLAVAL